MKQDRQSQRIRELNDIFRRSFMGGRIMLTRGVDELGQEAKTNLLEQIRAYDRFEKANDPHNEHDFGSIDVGGTKFFWKIDYYDLAMSQHSIDATNAEATVRVLTIMRADEY